MTPDLRDDRIEDHLESLLRDMQHEHAWAAYARRVTPIAAHRHRILWPYPEWPREQPVRFYER